MKRLTGFFLAWLSFAAAGAYAHAPNFPPPPDVKLSRLVGNVGAELIFRAFFDPR